MNRYIRVPNPGLPLGCQPAPNGDYLRAGMEISPPPLAILITVEHAAGAVCLCIANAGRERAHMPLAVRRSSH